MKRMKNILVFVGTYSDKVFFKPDEIWQGKGEGIYIFRMDPKTGEISLLSKGIGEPNPSYVILDRTKKYLYSVNELKEYEGLESGAVSAFSLNPETGKLTFLNRRACYGTDPCHLLVNNLNTHLLVANYSSGSVCLFPIAANGFLDPASFFLQHKKNINQAHKIVPHAHAIELDKDNNRAFVPDLGSDKVFIYKTDFINGHLAASDPAYIDTKVGAGPRHCTFHPSGKFFYLVTEKSSSLYSFLYDERKGTLELIQILSTLPDNYSGTSTGAAIKILPFGDYLYASNRGHDSVAIYKIDHAAGQLKLIAIQPTGGVRPRDFDFDPTGNFLLVANRLSNNIVVFKVNKLTGMIKEVFRVEEVSAPTSVKVYEVD